ncbi:hypothetical protein [Robertmurraya andreesenii]|uniref:Lipoprotein n=1 Tax=Anoxybacillus andreesenii TaxID=1325932 RepID=A0ABT9UZ42_9BACL|nr:hypothetical protein [Robertmurraya andreesenii]MDQ0153952.1 hypothetical protein [Robertmurraya andreesenii]
MKKAIISSVLLVIVLASCVPKNEDANQTIEKEIVETTKSFFFYTESNTSHVTNHDIMKGIVDQYWSDAEGGKLPKDSELIGLTEAEISERFQGEVPRYKVHYEEFINEVPVDKPNRLLWAYSIYKEDDSGMHLIFEEDPLTHDMKVIRAYIDTLSGPPASLEKFKLD